jgi:tRNA threonylcarbamoyladenosine biosynthesis protein TsaE
MEKKYFMKRKVTLEELKKIAYNLGKVMKGGEVVALIGDLGAGKTTFVKEFAKSLNILENIKSPTFNYVLEYTSGRVPLYHFDVYRLDNSYEVYDTGYEEYINGDGVVIVEWANIIEDELPNNYIRVELRYCIDENLREIEISAVNNVEFEKEIIKYVDTGN